MAKAGTQLIRIQSDHPQILCAKSLGGVYCMSKEETKILFVCVENARRSQMAAGFAETFAQGKLEVYNAGPTPSSQIDPLVIEVMKEKGIDLSGKRP